MNRKTECLVIIVLFAAGCALSGYAPVRAQDDAAHISQMAATLHREDMGDGVATLWIGGNLGKSVEHSKPAFLDVGTPMPSFTIKKFGTVQSVRSESLTGPYLLNFWASWCPPCRAEFPLLSKALAGGDLPFPIIFINTLDNADRATKFLKGQPDTLTVWFDVPPSDLSTQLGIHLIPTTVLVDAGGNIQAIQVGEMTERALQFFETIARNPGVGSYKPSAALLPLKPVTSAGATSLVPGFEHYGVLDDAHPYDTYTFSGKKGTLISLSMRARGRNDDDSTDPYLVVLDAKGKIVTSDDDGGGEKANFFIEHIGRVLGNGVDAQIVDFKLPTNGQYTVIAGRAGYEVGISRGPYQIIMITDGRGSF